VAAIIIVEVTAIDNIPEVAAVVVVEVAANILIVVSQRSS